MDARRAAFVYLSEGADLMSGNNKEKLLTVANLYKQILNILLSVNNYKNISNQWNNLPEYVWTSEKRLELADALRKIVELEKQVRFIVKEILENWE